MKLKNKNGKRDGVVVFSIAKQVGFWGIGFGIHFGSIWFVINRVRSLLNVV